MLGSTAASLAKEISLHLQDAQVRLSATVEQRFTSIEQQIDEIRQNLNALHTKYDEQTALLTQILARLPRS